MLKVDKIIKETNIVTGYFNEKQMRVLYPIVRKLPKDGLLLEIGTYHGRSTRFFSLANPDIKILTIDLVAFPDVPTRKGVIINSAILRLGNIFQVLGDASEIVKGFNWRIDLLFIDGSHLYEDVKKDILNWAPFVKSGGYIVCHDYEPTHSEVQKAVNEWMENNTEFEKINDKVDMLIVRKL